MTKTELMVKIRSDDGQHECMECRRSSASCRFICASTSFPESTVFLRRIEAVTHDSWKLVLMCRSNLPVVPVTLKDEFGHGDEFDDSAAGIFAGVAILSLQDVYEMLQIPDNSEAPAPQRNIYERFVEALRNYFDPQKCIDHHVFNFRKEAQRQDKNKDEFGHGDEFDDSAAGIFADRVTPRVSRSYNLCNTHIKEFELGTDPKSLETIYEPKSRPSARIERWVLRLQPYRYKANGEVERQNRTVLKALKISAMEKKPLKAELTKFFLLAYRSTPHCVTGKTPFSVAGVRERTENETPRQSVSQVEPCQRVTDGEDIQEEAATDVRRSTRERRAPAHLKDLYEV
ncbi:hypothetical protein CAPTEDRAFT_195408 [Capitella teleta]|uniref:Integrase catalytic domain-containing protein n=1 Tax=Capitella teleta TaxID=283909 RepID=R7T808_CAPTE|nr:hypothetical protein CAPTEDRAFT_195408 [Capitella teleta]|eukprot:ELT89588.1 hypothetical protein CAPTEDRAFT_195408 [Capitella teleta]